MVVNKLVPFGAFYEMTHIYTWRFLVLSNLIYLTSLLYTTSITIGIDLDKYVYTFVYGKNLFSSFIGVYYQSKLMI